MAAAVDLANKDGDQLAIYLLATSALNILRELLRKRGPDYVTRGVLEGMFKFAQQRARGEPLGFEADANTNQLIDRIAAGIRNGSIKSAQDLRATGRSPEYDTLRYITLPYNFMKHADRDPLAHLQENHVKPTEAILHSITAYAMLFPGELLPEMVLSYAAANVDKFQLG